MSRHVAAVDLGAESGRVAKISFDGDKLSVDLANRFANRSAVSDGLLRWRTAELWGEIQGGLSILGAGSDRIDSVGVDTWGVDYGLYDGSGNLIDEPVSYRDGRNSGFFTAALNEVGAENIYRATGLQILPINTLFALIADARTRPDRLNRARTLLMMPDVFHHRLSGSLVTEYTVASTTGAFDVAGGRWAVELLAELGVPTHMLPEVVQPGTDVGPLVADLAKGALHGARVIVPAGHDTASAVVGVPFTEPGAMFISSGTWSLVGVEVARPFITAESLRANLTNEGGYAGTIRLLRNVMGLWILQECRRQWAADGQDFSYADLAEMAAAEKGLRSVINPDADEFLSLGDMPARVRDYCARHFLRVPQTVAEIVRCVVDSLALSYRAVLDELDLVTGDRPSSVNIVGGGANNELLSQLTSDATGLPVFCGPAEGTALGNGAVQLAALGEFANLGEIRQAMARSTKIITYQPRGGAGWDEALGALLRLRSIDRAAADEGIVR